MFIFRRLVLYLLSAKSRRWKTTDRRLVVVVVTQDSETATCRRNIISQVVFGIDGFLNASVDGEELAGTVGKFPVKMVIILMKQKNNVTQARYGFLLHNYEYK